MSDYEILHEAVERAKGPRDFDRIDVEIDKIATRGLRRAELLKDPSISSEADLERARFASKRRPSQAQTTSR